MYIILEYYLLENFIINFLILFFTKIITKSSTIIKNIVLGAILCSIYSLVFFYPPLLFLTKFHMKIIISIIVIIFTFRSKNLKVFFYQLIGFYIISFMFAGAIIGISFNYTNVYNLLVQKVQVLEIFKFKYIALGLLIAILASYKIFNYYNNRGIQDSFIAEVTIVYKNKSASIKALIDTGNTLVEPFTNRPVFVVEFSEIQGILPDSLKDIYKKELHGDFHILEEALKNLNGDISLRLIPFKSLGNEGGILLGFRPDYLKIKLPDKEEVLERNMIIGIFQGELSGDLGYNGLLNYETILQEEQG